MFLEFKEKEAFGRWIIDHFGKFKILCIGEKLISIKDFSIKKNFLARKLFCENSKEKCWPFVATAQISIYLKIRETFTLGNINFTLRINVIHLIASLCKNTALCEILN